MKRYRKPLIALAIVCGPVLIFSLWLFMPRSEKGTLEIRFLEFTNDASGVDVGRFQITNSTDRRYIMGMVFSEAEDGTTRRVSDTIDTNSHSVSPGGSVEFNYVVTDASLASRLILSYLGDYDKRERSLDRWMSEFKRNGYDFGLLPSLPKPRNIRFTSEFTSDCV